MGFQSEVMSLCKISYLNFLPYEKENSFWKDILKILKYKTLKNDNTVQSRFSDFKFSDNLWFSDYFAKTIFQITT